MNISSEDQLIHDMIGAMCNAYQYMKNAIDYPSKLPLTTEIVEAVNKDFSTLIKRWHELYRS